MIELSLIGAFSAFGAGIVSFLSPCVLPLVPGYLSYIGGQSITQRASTTQSVGLVQRFKSVFLSLGFVLGFSTVFIAFGASATGIGRLLSAYRYEVNIIGGLIIIVFGLFISGLLRFAWLEEEMRYYGAIPGGKGLSAYLLGMAFAFGWTPCIGPILGAILTLSASSALVNDGMALLAIYSLGLGLPFILAAIFTETFMRHSAGLKRYGRGLQVIAGVLLILMGIMMVTGYMNDFSIWILQTFPSLGELG
jgi:cytochrome c-type biogenesis protein